MHIKPSMEEIQEWMVLWVYNEMPDEIAAVHRSLHNHLPPDTLKSVTHLKEDLEPTLKRMVAKGYLAPTSPSVIYRLTEQGEEYLRKMTSEELGMAEDEIKKRSFSEFIKNQTSPRR